VGGVFRWHLFQQSTLRDAWRSKLQLIEMTNDVGVGRARDGGPVRAGGVEERDGGVWLTGYRLDDFDVSIFHPERVVRVRFSFPANPAQLGAEQLRGLA
jgi:hypothetical protein